MSRGVRDLARIFVATTNFIELALVLVVACTTVRRPLMQTGSPTRVGMSHGCDAWNLIITFALDLRSLQNAVTDEGLEDDEDGSINVARQARLSAATHINSFNCKGLSAARVRRTPPILTIAGYEIVREPHRIVAAAAVS